MIVGEKVEIRKMENRHFHANGLNDKNPMIEEKGEKVVRKEEENRHLRVDGLNNKHIQMAAEWNRRRAEAEREIQTQRAEWNESRAGAEHQFGNQRGWNRNTTDDGTITIRSDTNGGTMINSICRNTSQIQYLRLIQFMVKNQKTRTGLYKIMA